MKNLEEYFFYYLQAVRRLKKGKKKEFLFGFNEEHGNAFKG